jgi:hypothetical protein
MAQLILDTNIAKDENFDEDNQLDNEDILNYRGCFHNEPDDFEQKYYEYGAHFPYEYICKKLELLCHTLMRDEDIIEYNDHEYNHNQGKIALTNIRSSNK